ncbi:P-loop NTPase fold protein [Microbacterium sp. NPDC089189]|uniref:KAP family P-loop NTPase fold protein n=1 Tax=Microbacterium sp. NPDC089189 TaxID=3154972 RepID=UPI0034139A4A
MSAGDLPIVVDIPSSSAGMGFDRYVAGISAAIRGGKPARYTVGLFGPWGSGKSSLLQGIAETLIADKSTDIVVVRFDAWRYQSSGSLVFALLQSIKRVVEKRPQMSAAVNALDKVLDRFEVSFLGVGLKYQRREPNSNEQYITPFEDLRALSSTLASKRIVVLVDDLDRCAPTAVVSVVEAIHLLTDVDGFVFVLALDYDYLISAIERAYKKIDAHHFIEKIVQIPFRIPHVNVRAQDIRALLPEWDTRLKPWFFGIEESTLVDIVYLALRSNPRQVKRLVNTYLLAQHMAGRSPYGIQPSSEDATSRLLLHLIALQLSWPLEYDALTRAIRDAALTSDSDAISDVGVFQELVETEDTSNWDSARLSRFLTGAFDEGLQLRELIPAIDLTASIAMSTPSDLDAPASEDTHVAQQDHNSVVDAAPEPLRLLFHELENDALDNNPRAALKANKSYVSITRPTKTFKNRVFATLEMLPGHIVVNVPLTFDELPEDLRHSPVYEVVSGRGRTAVRVSPDDDRSVEAAKRLIQISDSRLTNLSR